ncbi:MAG: phosphatase PAP2 family protein [Parachlamydiaceae bacterium]
MVRIDSRLWKWPLIATLILAPFLTWIDWSLTSYIYKIGNDPVEHFIAHPALDFLFDHGTIPATVTASLAGIIVLFSYLFKVLKKYRAAALTILLTFALGSGLMVNGVFKEYWGRPRPKQVEEFGGTQAFRPFYSPNLFHQPQPSKSFPCGHCAMGFFFFSLAFIGLQMRSKTVTAIGFALALILGIALSATRILQGGHFFSDTYFSALIMWYTTLAVGWLSYTAERTD